MIPSGLTLLELIRAWELCERWARLDNLPEGEPERLRSEAAEYRIAADKMQDNRRNAA